DLGAGIVHDLDQRPGCGGLHLDRRLVCLDLGDHVASGDGVAGMLEPAGHLAGLHVIAELGHLDRDAGHRVSGTFQVPPAGRSPEGASVSSRYHTGTSERSRNESGARGTGGRTWSSWSISRWAGRPTATPKSNSAS